MNQPHRPKYWESFKGVWEDCYSNYPITASSLFLLVEMECTQPPANFRHRSWEFFPNPTVLAGYLRHIWLPFMGCRLMEEHPWELEPVPSVLLEEIIWQANPNHRERISAHQHLFQAILFSLDRALEYRQTQMVHSKIRTILSVINDNWEGDNPWHFHLKLEDNPQKVGEDLLEIEAQTGAIASQGLTAEEWRQICERVHFDSSAWKVFRDTVDAAVLI